MIYWQEKYPILSIIINIEKACFLQHLHQISKFNFHLNQGYQHLCQVSMYYNTKALFGRALELSSTSELVGAQLDRSAPSLAWSQPIPGAATTRVENHRGKTSPCRATAWRWNCPCPHSNTTAKMRVSHGLTHSHSSPNSTCSYWLLVVRLMNGRITTHPNQGGCHWYI